MAIRFPSPPPCSPASKMLSLGAIPGLPKVHLHNPVLAYEVGDDFMKYWYMAGEGKLDPFVLVVEGSIPNEKIKNEGYWAALGTDPNTGQPITTNEWIDRLAPKALAVVGAGTCATYGGIHAMAGNPTGCMGLADYLGWDWKSKAGSADRECAWLPGAARQLHGDAAVSAVSSGGPGAHDSARRSTASDVAVRQHGPRRLRPRRLLRAGRFRRRVRLAEVHRETRLLGTGGELQCPQARLDGRHRRLSECGRHLHRLHHARVSRTSSCRSWTSRRGPSVSARRSASTAARSARLRSITNDTVNKEPKWRHPGSATDHRLSPEDLLAEREGAIK